MKLSNKAIIFLSMICFIAVADESSQNISNVSNNDVVQKSNHTCSCGPAEHWFFKSCVKIYNQQFPEFAFPEDDDTEGLSENIIQAIDMLAALIVFIDKDGRQIVPEKNKKGKVILPLTKNVEYVLCKKILHTVDLQTTLTAEELYALWLVELQAMKKA